MTAHISVRPITDEHGIESVTAGIGNVPFHELRITEGPLEVETVHGHAHI